MMTPYMIIHLSVPTENLRVSLLVCLFSINIPVHRTNVELAANVLGILTRRKT